MIYKAHKAPPPGAWAATAPCTEVDPDVFFPEKGGPGAGEAKQVCRGCDVREQCLAYAVEHRIEWGIWGGVSFRTRRRMWMAADKNKMTEVATP